MMFCYPMCHPARLYNEASHLSLDTHWLTTPPAPLQMLAPGAHRMLNHSMRSMGVDMHPSQQQEPYHRGGDPYGRGGPPPHLQQVPGICGRP